tara:strand:+ start:2059 stop:2736 length:678 start_codon:yes stop_codon:yes gene_type:complete
MVNVFLLGIILSIIHYYSQEYNIRNHKYTDKIISFSAGVGVTYIFVELFPSFNKLVTGISPAIFLTILVGFVFFHLVEKFIYQHAGGKHAPKELAVEDSAVSFFYHFIVGAFIVYFTKQSSLEGFLFFIPIALHTSTSALPVDIPLSKGMKIFISSSSLLGVILTSVFFTSIPTIAFIICLGLMVGTLTFTNIRHSIPEGKKGKPLYFLLGVVFYTLVIYFSKGF